MRHAYVRTEAQRTGVGARLLAQRPRRDVETADARRDVGRRGVGRRLLPQAWLQRRAAGADPRLLRRYWDIPERQVETSVVLADDLAMLFIV